jgi:phosphoglycolate phosphatase
LQIRSVLFDLDGTIWDSRNCILNSLSETFARAGVDAASSAISKELSGFESPVALLRSRGLPLTSFWAVYERHLAEVRLCFESTSYVLATLKKKGLRIGFVTSLKQEFVNKLLARFGLKAFPETVITPSQCRIPKPNPASINLALARLHANPQEAVYIGNQTTDIIAAKRANCWSGLATWGLADEPKPEADFEFEKLDQVLELVN